MLEAQVVTADGTLWIANACQNQDLFWALRGGGGGTYGVVTQVTLLAHPAPSHLGLVLGTIKAESDDAFLELITRFVAFYRETLMREVLATGRLNCTSAKDRQQPRPRRYAATMKHP
jgi:FAD/FMN-containing dehydrogenase